MRSMTPRGATVKVGKHSLTSGSRKQSSRQRYVWWHYKVKVTASLITTEVNGGCVVCVDEQSRVRWAGWWHKGTVRGSTSWPICASSNQLYAVRVRHQLWLNLSHYTGRSYEHWTECWLCPGVWHAIYSYTPSLYNNLFFMKQAYCSHKWKFYLHV